MVPNYFLQEKPESIFPFSQGLYIKRASASVRSHRVRNTMHGLLVVLEGSKQLDTAEGVEEKLLFKRVLVPPLFGLEENSRYYSVAMVLQHLLDVGSALQARIPKLSRGEKPPKRCGSKITNPTPISMSILSCTTAVS